MYKFLTENRAELVDRCAAKVALRSPELATTTQRIEGIPLFLQQLTATLEAEESGDRVASRRISGGSGGDLSDLSKMGTSALAHGRVLLNLGYTVDQVVHDYGDLCQAITDLAVERETPFSVNHFRTLNRCLDNAIADAVVGFALQRDAALAVRSSADENQRIGFLVHELRNQLQTATLAFTALESGKLAIGGSTSALVKRSLAGLATLLTDAISEVRTNAVDAASDVFSLASFIADAKVAGMLLASVRGCTFRVAAVDPQLFASGNRLLLAAALLNLLQNAFKFTQTNTEVTLHASVVLDRIHIEVQDRCGGLPPAVAANLFAPFVQGNADRTGLGLGLPIARRSVESDAGRLTARDLPGTGCIFTIDLPRHLP